MATLTEKEIMDLLKKLGLESTSEIDTYFEEYRDYMARKNSPEPPREINSN